jgi:hypothetical protein
VLEAGHEQISSAGEVADLAEPMVADGIEPFELPLEPGERDLDRQVGGGVAEA